MSSYRASFTFPVPVGNVVPAAVYGASSAGFALKAQGTYAMKCRSGLTFTTYPVTIELSVTGVDGAAVVSIDAHNFGFGPFQSGACRDRATKLLDLMWGILQIWAAQAWQAANVPPAGTAGA